MIGIILMSHGKMAEGMLESSKLFFDEPVKIKALCIEEGDNPEDFDQRILDAAKELDDGSGVIALCDLLGGTPSNRSMRVLNDRLQVITGMNLTMFLELLGLRMSSETIDDIDIDSLIETGKNGIVSLNNVVNRVCR